MLFRHCCWLLLCLLCLLPARPFGRWIVAITSVLQLAFGLVLIGFAYVQAVYHPLDLGYADRSRMLRGWDKLAADIRQRADEAGAEVIWTEGNYRLTGVLFFYGRAAGDSRPVRDIAPHPRYDFLPAESRYPASTPALLVVGVKSPAAAEALPPRPEFSSTRLVTVLKRDEGAGRGEEYYAVLAVSGATGALPRLD